MAAATADHKPYNDGERARIEKAGGVVSMKRVDGDLAVVRAWLAAWRRPPPCFALPSLLTIDCLSFPPLATKKRSPRVSWLEPSDPFAFVGRC